MKIDAIGCLHSHYPKLNGGDLLIITGDITANHSVKEWNEFFNWLDKQQYKRKVLVGGNHDNFATQWALSDDSIYDILCDKPTFTYLWDSGCEIEGLKIWGSPWSLEFEGINPRCNAFTGTEEELKDKFALIPEDTDILITHAPPYGILDAISRSDGSIENCGSISLRNITLGLPNLKLHVFSHIHEWGGRNLKTPMAQFVNVSIMNERYKPVNKPFTINI